jgi:hypothetical protein
MLVAGFICNLMIKPVDPRWYMNEEEVLALQAKTTSTAMADGGSYGIGRGGLDAGAVVAWLIVGVPIAWGVWITLSKAWVLFG